MGAHVNQLQFDLNGTSPAAASTVIGKAILGLQEFGKVVLGSRLLGATGGALDVYIQTTYDGGTTWHDVCHFAQVAAAAALAGFVATITRGPRGTAAITAVNAADGTPALAANTVVDALGNGLRVVYVAGAGTSAGAVQTITGLATRV